MSINKQLKDCKVFWVFLLCLNGLVNLYAQSSSNPNITFAVGNKRITVASNGDILSTTKAESPYEYNNDNIILLSYDDLSVDVSRDISVWKGRNFPSVFYFPIDKHLLIRQYRNNDAMLTALDKLIKSKHIVEALDTIEIIGACSPVGSEEYNLKLALSRSMALRSYLRWKHLQFAESFPIKFSVIGVDKLGYSILKKQKPPLTEKQIWDKLQYAAIRLKMKDGTYIIPGADKPDDYSYHYTDSKTDTVYLRDTLYIGSRYNTSPEKQQKPQEQKKPFHLAIKTNLLYDAVLLPNLTAEIYLGKRWSLAVEGNLSWWTFDQPVQNWWDHRIQVAGTELRYWVKSPYPLHGHAVGLYSLFGNYDVRLFTKNEDTKGWLSRQSWSAGLSYAYSMPIARNFNMEFGFALGYVGGRYYEYNYCMKHEQWEQQAIYNRNYFGPTRVGISLVWLPGTGNKCKKQ